MNRRNSSFGSVITLLALLLIGPGADIASSQPPAIGPPVNRTRAGELSVFTITVFVRAKTLDIVNETNARLEAAGESARVSINEIKVFRPSRVDTLLANGPNSTIVRLPMIVTIKVKIPVFGDRFISIPIDINVSCEGWQNPVGTIAVFSQPGPASIEGGSIFEDILQVREIIDAKIRENFQQPPPSTFPPVLADPRCKNIGVTDFGTATPNDDAIHFDRPLTRPIGQIVGATVEVRFDRLKRLRARNFQGGVVYREVEQISLNAFANYTQLQKTLSMREGDEVSLNLPPVKLSAATFEKLVVIGNIEQPPDNPKDTGFKASLRIRNFEPGSHVLVIPKFFTQPPDKFNPKPRIVPVNAYELSYTVRFNEPVIVQ